MQHQQSGGGMRTVLSEAERMALLRITAAAPSMLKALLYVQQAVEGGESFGMSIVNAAIREAVKSPYDEFKAAMAIVDANRPVQS